VRELVYAKLRFAATVGRSAKGTGSSLRKHAWSWGAALLVSLLGTACTWTAPDSGSTKEASGIVGRTTAYRCHPNDSSCRPAPRGDVRFLVRSARTRRVLARVRSEGNGDFRVSIRPGRYILSRALVRGVAFKDRFVVVPRGSYTHVLLVTGGPFG
jgi:hypothetical protein